MKIRFTVVGAGSLNGEHEFPITVTFGGLTTGDSYEKPRVMACCKPYDDEVSRVYQDHYVACFDDFAVQGCRSLHARLEEAKKELSVGDAQLTSLMNWIASHQNGCRQEFYIASGAASHEPQSATDYFTLNHTWDLPSSAETTNIKDIEIEVSLGKVNGIEIPEDEEDWLTCESMADNNDVFFLKADPDGAVLDLSSGSADIHGPDFIAGSEGFTSAATGCSFCSLISVEWNEVGLSLESLVLDTAEPTTVGNRSDSMLVDRARIALNAPRQATYQGGDTWSIGAGEATFVVSAFGEGEAGALILTNATAIELEEIPPSTGGDSSWEVQPFDIVYVDSGSETWTLEVDTLLFEP